MCRPEIVLEDVKGENGEVQRPMLEMIDLRHPMLALNFRNKKLIANDIVLNGKKEPASTILLTGPNMGGKSTLLR